MKEGKDYIIFALDLPTAQEAMQYIGALSEHVAMFKIGLELFIRSGPEIVSSIREQRGPGIFLDLKLHDIPATVKRAMAVISDMGVKLATVHCGESDEMLVAAVEGSRGRVGVLGVTVLTSVSGHDLEAAGLKKKWCSNLGSLALKRAESAQRAGCAGVICSPLEVKIMKERLGHNFLAITPGIRPSWEAIKKDDQKRVATPAAAVQDGADFLVIGRPIRDAHDPATAAQRIASEIDSSFL